MTVATGSFTLMEHSPEQTQMIELIKIKLASAHALDLWFSDGSTARWSADAILAKTVLLRPPTERQAGELIML